MDEESDVQIVDVSEPERESDEFEDGVKESFNKTSLWKFTRHVQKYSGSTPTHLITFLNTLVLRVS